MVVNFFDLKPVLCDALEEFILTGLRGLIVGVFRRLMLVGFQGLYIAPLYKVSHSCRIALSVRAGL